jgi:hypothetical protein
MKNEKRTIAEKFTPVNIPKILFERVETYGKAAGIAPHEFVIEAVSEKLASIHKEKRKKQRL